MDTVSDQPLESTIPSIPINCSPMDTTGVSHCQSMFDRVQHQTEAVIYGLILILSLVSNGLIFLLFYRRPTMRTFSNRFVLSLSFSHILQSLCVMPSVLVTSITDTWIFGDLWCQISGTLTICLNVTSALSLLLIAVDRNCAVNNPLHYSMTITKRRTGALIACTWISAVLLSLPPLFGLSHIEFRPGWHTCSIAWDSGDIANIVYGWLLSVIGFLVPFCNISWIYCLMFRAARMNSARARKHSVTACLNDVTVSLEPKKEVGVLQLQRNRKLSQKTSSSTTSSLFFGEEWKAARTGLLVVCSFLFCWLPFFLILLVEPHLSKDALVPDFLRFFVTFTTFTACIINPYLYVFRNKASRKHVKKLLECHTVHNRRDFFVFRQNNRNNTKKGTNNQIRSYSSNCILQLTKSTDSQSVVTTAVPICYEESGCRWQRVDTCEEAILKDDTLDNVSNDSCDMSDKEMIPRDPCVSNEEKRDLVRAQIFSLRPARPLLHQDSTSSSDSSDVGVTSLDSSINANDDSTNWYSHFNSRKDSRSSITSLLGNSHNDRRNNNLRTAYINHEKFGRVFLCLNRTNSIGHEDAGLRPVPSVASRLSETKRMYSSTHDISHNSSEVNLISSGSTDSQEMNSLPTRSKSSRHKLFRQNSTFEPSICI